MAPLAEPAGGGSEASPDRGEPTPSQRALTARRSRPVLEAGAVVLLRHPLVPRRHPLRGGEEQVPLVAPEPVVVTFDFDADVLPAERWRELRRSLRRLLAAVAEGGAPVVLHVAGHTDALGEKAYNRALAARRADHVGDLLRSWGVTVRQWTYGASCPRVTERRRHGRDLPDAREQNRRVVVSVVDGSGVDAAQECLPGADVRRTPAPDAPPPASGDGSRRPTLGGGERVRSG